MDTASSSEIVGVATNATNSTSYEFLFWGYASLWSILAIYILLLGIRLCRLEKRVSKLNEKEDAVKS